MMSTKKLLFTTLRGCLYFLLFLFVICKTSNTQNVARYLLIPYSSHLEKAKGYFTLSAKTPTTGYPLFINGIQQLQLLEKDTAPKGLLTALYYFFSIEYRKTFISVMALYKTNSFHLHFTNDQSCRFEIKQYLKLTEQEQIKAPVKYSNARHISILPETNMPIHIMAAITSYPFRSGSGQNIWQQTASLPVCYARTVHSVWRKIFSIQSVAYSPLPDLHNIAGENVFTGLNVHSPIKNMVIHYTTDGIVPQSNSTVLLSSFIIIKSTTAKRTAISKSGTRGDIYTLHDTKEEYREPVMAANSFTGSIRNYYKSFFKNTFALQGAKGNSIFTIDSIYVPVSVNAPGLALQYRGYINVPETGIYSSDVTGNNGSIENITNRNVTDNDKRHSAIEKSGQIALEKGYSHCSYRSMKVAVAFGCNLYTAREMKYQNSFPQAG